MLKEIYEQPWAVRETVLGRTSAETGQVYLHEMGLDAAALRAIDRVVILACGTSWHAGLVGKFLIEAMARLPVEVDYGSEFRYRNPIVDGRTLAVVITQSGETADTLGSLREAKRLGAKSVAICNVVGSMATREADGPYTRMPDRDRRRVNESVHEPARRPHRLAIAGQALGRRPIARAKSSASSRNCPLESNSAAAHAQISAGGACITTAILPSAAA